MCRAVVHRDIILPHAIIQHVLPFYLWPSINGLHGKFLEDFAVGINSSVASSSQLRLQRGRHGTAWRVHFIWLFLAAISFFITMAMEELSSLLVSPPYIGSASLVK